MATDADDPTNQLLRGLDDPAKYVKRERIAVFRAHRRTDDKGKVLYEVTDGDLAEIAANTNKPYESGQLVRLTIGHTKQDPNAKESRQPAELVGYCTNYRAQIVQRPGGSFLAVTHTEYAQADKVEQLAKFPFRSVEYDPEGKTIHGCAALLKTPYLQLGTVEYAGGKRFFCYSMGDCEMADAAADDEKKEEEEYAKFAKRMKRYEAWSAEEKAKADADKTTNNEKAVVIVEYAALASQVAALQAQQAADRKALVESNAKRMLDPLKPYVAFDYARELKTLTNYATDAERAEHVGNLVKYNAKLPTGGLLPLADAPETLGVKDPATDPTVAPPNHEKVMAYVRANPGVSYDQATAKIAHG